MILQATRTVEETRDVGAEIAQHLGQNRVTIEGARTKVILSFE